MRTLAATFLLFVVLMDFTLFFVDGAMNEVNPDANRSRIWDYDSSMAKQYDQGNYTVIEYSDDELPSSVTSVDTSSGFFTDIWATIKGFVTAVKNGVSFAINLVNAVPRAVSFFGWPTQLTFAIGFLWHVLTIFALIMFARGD